MFWGEEGSLTTGLARSGGPCCYRGCQRAIRGKALSSWSPQIQEVERERSWPLPYVELGGTGGNGGAGGMAG